MFFTNLVSLLIDQYYFHTSLILLMCLGCVQGLSEQRKENGILARVVRHVFYDCHTSVGHRSNECRSKEENKFLKHLFELVSHMSYKCHTNVRHQRVLDTATRLILEVFVLHRSTHCNISLELLSCVSCFLEGSKSLLKDGVQLFLKSA